MGVIAVALAIVLAFTKIDSAFDMFQRVLGLTASGLGGLFLLGSLVSPSSKNPPSPKRKPDELPRIP